MLPVFLNNFCISSVASKTSFFWSFFAEAIVKFKVFSIIPILSKSEVLIEEDFSATAFCLTINSSICGSITFRVTGVVSRIDFNILTARSSFSTWFELITAASLRIEIDVFSSDIEIIFVINCENVLINQCRTTLGKFNHLEKWSFCENN